MPLNKETKLNQKWWFIVKESQHYNVSVLINHRQDIKNVDRSMMDV